MPGIEGSEITKSPEPPGEAPVALRRSIVLRHDSVRGTDVLVMPERVVVLNRTAAEILALCDGSRTVAEIVAVLEQRYPGSPAGERVPTFLDRVRTAGWLR